MPIDIAAAYVAHAAHLRSFLLRRVGDADLADDLLSQVFEHACRDAARYQDRGIPIRAWLFAIARSRLIDHYRAERRRGQIVALEACAHSDDGGIDAALQRLEGAPLRAALAQIAPRYQQVITLRFLDDRSLADVAELMRVDTGAVKALQHRALAALKSALGLPIAPPAHPCRICGKPTHAQGLCVRHYRQQQRRRAA